MPIHTSEPGFVTRLRSALTGDDRTPLVHLGNLEVEQFWAAGEVGLPRPSFDAARRVVNRMDELAVGLAVAGDQVALKSWPDPALLSLRSGLGLPAPGIVAAARADPDRTITEDLLVDDGALRRLAGLVGDGAYLAPHGVSDLEERLAERTGLPLAAAPAAVCKAVNGKTYSRRLATELDLRQPTGWACESLDELTAVVAEARALVAEGRSVAVKDSYGVSGKGIVVVTDATRLDRLHRMVVGQARRAGTDRVGLVVEEWVPKGVDINYQFTVARDGTIRFDFVKEALTERGIHKGHLMPARLEASAVAELERCATAVGARLHADGYFGVVGVDAMTDPDGGLYPIVEINARNNMSTYQTTLHEHVAGPGMVALARHYPLRLAQPVPLQRIQNALDGVLLERPGGTGLVVMASATVNANVGAEPFTGRLYALLVAGGAAELSEVDDEVAGRLGRMEECT
jgi:D-alanine-D-alanine ligase-like ATP-grasp enzyme